MIEPLLPLLLNPLGYGDSLRHPLVHPKHELLVKQFFPNGYPLDLDCVIVLPVLLHVSIVVVVVRVFLRTILLVLILLLFVLDGRSLALVLCLLVPLDGLRLELVQDVLDLPLELLIRILHNVLKHLTHAQLVRLGLQALTSQNRVERAVDVSAHLQVLTLDKLSENLENLWDLLALSFSLSP